MLHRQKTHLPSPQNKGAEEFEKGVTNCASILFKSLPNLDLLEFASDPKTSDADIKKAIQLTEANLPPHKADPINQCMVVMHSAATGEHKWVKQFDVSEAQRKQAIENAKNNAR